ncbi:MAG: LysR family transcriptional regulator [Acutalibacteraceae bacterium]
MKINQIRYFLEVASSGHVTKSAEKLHIAQPALTQSIKRLEKSLGIPLFESCGRNIRLTEYGEYLQKKLKTVIEELDSIPQELEKMRDLEEKTVRIAALAASSIVTEAIMAYKKLHSDVMFRLFQNSDEERCDIEITTKLFLQHDESRHQRTVFSENIFLAVPSDGKFADMCDIPLASVKNEGFICLLGSKQLRYICDRFCHHAGFEPKIVFESDNPTAVKNMIASNIGVGFWPEFSWGRLESDSVKLLKITDPVCQRDIVITLKSGAERGKTAEDFFEFLSSYLEKLSVESVYDN